MILNSHLNPTRRNMEEKFNNMKEVEHLNFLNGKLTSYLSQWKKSSKNNTTKNNKK